MDINTAIQDLKKFREKYGVSRDKAIEIYNKFKFDRQIQAISEFINGNTVNINRDEFWDNINTTIIRDVYSVKNATEQDLEEIKIYNTKLRKEKLKANDKLSFERKSFTKQLREINSLEELNEKILEQLRFLRTNPHKEIECFTEIDNTNPIGLIQLSDIHANELINEKNNKYDFTILSKRLYNLAQKAKIYFNAQGVKRIVVAITGDALNSDRRQVEMFNMATNRSKALVLLFDILRQFLNDLSLSYNITVTTVTGNESRVVGEEYDTSDIMCTYNYDFTLHNMLNIAFEENERVTFINTGDFAERVLDINGTNVLFLHGVNIKSDIEKSVQQLIGRYANQGINIDYVMFGHMHSCRIGDIYARSSSMCGANSYSNGNLNLTSKASQNIGIFYNNKSHDVIKIDLQNTIIDKYYPFNAELEAYNVKSADKKDEIIIHRIS